MRSSFANKLKTHKHAQRFRQTAKNEVHMVGEEGAVLSEDAGTF